MKTKSKKLLSMLLILALGISAAFTQTASSAGEPSISFEVWNATELNDALAAAASNSTTTIRLMDNITRNVSITVLGNRTFIFDLNGKILDITSTGNPIRVESGEVRLLDPSNGELNATGTNGGSAVWAQGGGKAEVTNATTIGSVASYGVVQASNNNSEIIVHGNVTRNGAASTGCGAAVTGSGKITVNGKISVLAGEPYIRIGTTDMAQVSGQVSITKPGYYEYSDGIGTIWVKDPGAALTYGISLKPSADKDFGLAMVGYGKEVGSHSVTISNTGTQPTGTLTIALSGANAGSFELSNTSISNIAVSGSVIFNVTPNFGLAAGKYGATVTVSGVNVVSQSFNVIFVVVGAKEELSFKAEQIGGVSGKQDSLGIVITFDNKVTGLTEDDMIVGDGRDIGKVKLAKVWLVGEGDKWAIIFDSVETEGTVTLAIADFGPYTVTTRPRGVPVYKAGPVGAGVTVSGSVRSYNPKLAITVTLYDAVTKSYVDSTTIPAESGTGQATQRFVLESVAAGTYDLVITKDGHLSYSITSVIVADYDIDLSYDTSKAYSTITLLAGDINGDGRINVNDVTYLLIEYNKVPTDWLYADVDGSGSVNVQDITYLLVNYNKVNVIVDY